MPSLHLLWDANSVHQNQPPRCFPLLPATPPPPIAVIAHNKCCHIGSMLSRQYIFDISVSEHFSFDIFVCRECARLLLGVEYANAKPNDLTISVFCNITKSCLKQHAGDITSCRYFEMLNVLTEDPWNSQQLFSVGSGNEITNGQLAFSSYMSRDSKEVFFCLV